MDLQIVFDPVTDFWKCPKRGLKKLGFDIFHQGGGSNQIC